MRHYLNPLHVYCRFKDPCLPRDVAEFLSKVYKHTLFKYL